MQTLNCTWYTSGKLIISLKTFLSLHTGDHLVSQSYYKRLNTPDLNFEKRESSFEDTASQDCQLTFEEYCLT